VKSSCLDNKRNSDQEKRNERYPSRLSTVLSNRRRSVSESDVTTKKHVEFLDQMQAKEKENSVDLNESEIKSLNDENAEVDCKIEIQEDNFSQDAVKINTNTDDSGVDKIEIDCVSDTEPSFEAI